MLLINGYTSAVSSFLRFSPQPKQKYWAVDKSAAFFVLKDFNIWHIHPKSSIFSNAKRRYKEGFEFAKKNISNLRSHILISGNRLQIIAHSYGVAFAEGIAAFLYEEEKFVAELLVSLQGAQLENMPQVKNAIMYRVDFKTDGDFIANRSKQKMSYSNLEITETSLKTGFLKYRILQNGINGLAGAEYLYIRGKIPFLNHHMANRKRQFEIWTAINHAMALYTREPEIANLFKPKDLKPEVLKQFIENQN